MIGLTQQSYAEGLTIKPGLWEITTTTTSSMGQPMNRTDQECIDKDQLDPKDMMQDMPEDCSLDSNVSGDTLTYELTCNMHGMVMQGMGKMISKGDSMTGSIKVNSNMNGMVIEMSSEAKGKRIGEC